MCEWRLKLAGDQGPDAYQKDVGHTSAGPCYSTLALITPSEMIRANGVVALRGNLLDSAA
jgi:hypothetical protein